MSSHTATSVSGAVAGGASAPLPARRPLPTGAAELLALGLVALAALAGLTAERLAAPTNLALVFVLPVVVAAVRLGFRPALAAALGGVIAFDLLFVEPRRTLRVANPSDLWALALLLAVAVIVSGLAARLRRQAAQAAAAAAEARALERLAHAVLHGGSEAEAARLAVEGLSQVFAAPAAVVEAVGERCRVLAGGAGWREADCDAALWVIEQGLALRAGSYPHDGTRFDLWPVADGRRRLALAVDFEALPGGRPVAPERFVEAVAAYLALAGRRTA